jgi:hypothetical protein
MMAEAVACSAVLTVCCRTEKLAALARAIAVSVNYIDEYAGHNYKAQHDDDESDFHITSCF